MSFIRKIGLFFFGANCEKHPTAIADGNGVCTRCAKISQNKQLEIWRLEKRARREAERLARIKEIKEGVLEALKEHETGA